MALYQHAYRPCLARALKRIITTASGLLLSNQYRTPRGIKSMSFLPNCYQLISLGIELRRASQYKPCSIASGMRVQIGFATAGGHANGGSQDICSKQ